MTIKARISEHKSQRIIAMIFRKINKNHHRILLLQQLLLLLALLNRAEAVPLIKREGEAARSSECREVRVPGILTAFEGIAPFESLI